MPILHLELDPTGECVPLHTIPWGTFFTIPAERSPAVYNRAKADNATGWSTCIWLREDEFGVLRTTEVSRRDETLVVPLRASGELRFQRLGPTATPTGPTTTAQQAAADVLDLVTTAMTQASALAANPNAEIDVDAVVRKIEAMSRDRLVAAVAQLHGMEKKADPRVAAVFRLVRHHIEDHHGGFRIARLLQTMPLTSGCGATPRTPGC